MLGDPERKTPVGLFSPVIVHQLGTFSGADFPKMLREEKNNLLMFLLIDDRYLRQVDSCKLHFLWPHRRLVVSDVAAVEP